MNKPAIVAPSWTTTPKWYLWDGGFLLISGSEGIVPRHSHHAIQVVIAIDGETGISADGGEWRSGRGVIVPPDTDHSYSGQGAFSAMFFVDPESMEGAWLRSAIGDSIAFVPETRVAAAADALRRFSQSPFDSMEVGQLIRFAIESFCPTAPPVRHRDERITRVLQSIASSENLRIGLEEAAAMVFLSPSRFQHLFKQQVGLPFRRYILWRKLARSMVSIPQERTLVAAAQAAGFADAAHLTRTYIEMFGLPPSLLMQGDLHVIASPFEIVERAA